MNKMTTSIAMLTYNGEKYVMEQLKSICNQTIVPDEIVICDDCSTDNTVNLINKFIEETTIKVNLFVNQKNIGVRKNSEKAYSLCNGEIVFLCDQDDVWECNKIERILDEFLDEDVVLVFSDAYVVDESLNVIYNSEWFVNWTNFNTQDFFDYCQTRKFPLGHLQAFKRSFVQKITPFLSDTDGWIAQCAPAFGDVVAIPDKLLYYRRHNNTASTAFSKKNGYYYLLKRMLSMGFQEYFTWPDAELKTYSQIKEYVESNGCHVKPDSLNEHIVYLKSINDCEQRGLLYRIKMLNKLYKYGVYQRYRGNKNTLRYDKLFMCVNSLTRK